MSNVIPLIGERRAGLESLCQRYRVKRLDVFGSISTGAFRPESSDLDFIVTFDRPEEPGYADRYFGLLEGLETLFGRSIDLIVDSAIKNPFFRESVERTRVPVYAA